MFNHHHLTYIFGNQYLYIRERDPFNDKLSIIYFISLLLWKNFVSFEFKIFIFYIYSESNSAYGGTNILKFTKNL